MKGAMLVAKSLVSGEYQITGPGQESSMRYWTLIAAFIVGGPVMVASPASAQSQNWLLGTWKLVSATQIENSQAKEYLGSRPLGQVIFGADGQFSNILLRSDMPKFGILSSSL